MKWLSVMLLVAMGLSPALAQAQDDLVTEVLPKDGWAYHWENFAFGARRFFTFDAEKKVELDQRRLHVLDGKLEACAEMGDEDCVDKIERRSERLQAITERFLQNRQEIGEAHRIRLEAWQERHEERLRRLREMARERRGQTQEIRRQGFLEQREQRQQNREKLIDMRSDRVKERQDAVRDLEVTSGSEYR